MSLGKYLNACRSSMIFCIRDSKDVVLYQNSKCKSFCDDMTSKTCSKNCTKISLKNCSEFLKNHSYTKSIIIENKHYQSTTIHDSDLILNFLQPIDNYQTDILTHAIENNLTGTEKKVSHYLLMGYKNQQISSFLNIKKSTLKTHLNSIYKKITFLKDLKNF